MLHGNKVAQAYSYLLIINSHLTDNWQVPENVTDNWQIDNIF